jgi:CHAT domain-containing protein
MPLSLLRPDGWRELIGDRLSVSILPSLSNAAELHWIGINQDRALVFGNPDLRLSNDWQFPDLPGAEREARAVINVVPGALFLGSAATSKELYKHASEPTILYMATHAVADEDNALDGSFIALSDRLVF